MMESGSLIGSRLPSLKNTFIMLFEKHFPEMISIYEFYEEHCAER
jgi:hypothetical protein